MSSQKTIFVIHANFMRLALCTGMRRGELFKLMWADIDFERGYITIRGPKGGKDQIIPLNQAAREVLESHPRDESPFVFPGREGRQRTRYPKRIDAIRERAGLPQDFRHLHGLRHVYASMLASSGQVDLYTLQKLSGQSAGGDQWITKKWPMDSAQYFFGL